jgi:hypothetical protein
MFTCFVTTSVTIIYNEALAFVFNSSVVEVRCVPLCFVWRAFINVSILPSLVNPFGESFFESEMKLAVGLLLSQNGSLVVPRFGKLL